MAEPISKSSHSRPPGAPARGAFFLKLNFSLRLGHPAGQAGRIHVEGWTQDVLNADMVRAVFGLESRIIADPVSGRPLMLPIGRHQEFRTAQTSDDPTNIADRTNDLSFRE